MSALNIVKSSFSANKTSSRTRTRVKICGITRECDVEAVCESGADAIGFVFYEKSPRAIALEQAKKLAQKVSPFVTRVGLFVNANEKQILATLEKVNLDVLQFHGDEPEQDCIKFHKPYIKAIRMAPGLDLLTEMNNYPSASGFLLDSYKKDVPGGTGQVFNWQSIPKNIGQTIAQPIILAGGLNPSNVSEAIITVRPYAVDVSGGVESEQGIKDKTLIQRLINEVCNVN